MTVHIPFSELCLRLFIASLFGLIIGWERETKKKPAGVRTHMMVSLGAASFTVMTLEWAYAAAGPFGAGVDPSRTMHGIIGGIGFLGAGSIIQARGHVQGITTAAGIWVSGAIGVGCGAGQYATASVTLLLCVLILAVMPRIENRLIKIARPSLDRDTAENDEAES